MTPGEWDPVAVQLALDRLSGKWTVAVLAALRSGPLRPSELKQLLPDAPERVLLSHLRSLRDRGLLEREEIASLPVSAVYYRLTDRSLALATPLAALQAWIENLDGDGLG